MAAWKAELMVVRLAASKERHLVAMMVALKVVRWALLRAVSTVSQKVGS